jgi:DNA-binding transcriptional MerR regulator
MKAGDSIEKTYKTSEVAKVVGVHPNTVRMYEELGLIPKPIRKENGYRVFTDIHIDQIKLVRTAFQIEVLQNGLRKKIVSVVKISALGQYDKALALTKEYIKNVQIEIEKANEAMAITNGLLQGISEENSVFLKRKNVSDGLGITMDTLRNWEMNGLLRIKRKDNGYRVYSEKDIMMLKIIQTLRCANYSLSSILRMINTLFEEGDVDIGQVLNTPNKNEDIISVCDKLIVSLNAAKENAEQLIVLLTEMKSKYLNPTV